MRVSHWLLGTWLLGLGCADVSPLPAGACGNAVVDSKSEDCDSVAPEGLRCGVPADEAAPCRFVCESAADCPPGWACAPDHACVHHSSSFGFPTTTSAAFDAWAFGDVDGDGVIDLAGMEGPRLEVRHGEGSGHFGEKRERHIARRGDPWFGDANGDGLLEAAVPTISGVVLLRGEEEGLGFVPLSYTASGHLWQGPYTEIRAMALGMPPGYARPPDSPWHDKWKTECDGVLVLSAQPGQGLFGTTTLLPGEVQQGSLLDASICKSEPNPMGQCMGSRAVRLERAASAPPDVGSGVLVAPPLSDHVVVATVGVVGSWPKVASPQFPTLPEGLLIAAAASPFVAAAPGADELAVFVPAQDSKQQLHWLRATREASGELGPLTVDSRLKPSNPCAAAPEQRNTPLAAADLDSDGFLDFVMPHGLCKGASDDLPLELVPFPAVSWQEVAVADFDGNGTLDVAGLSSDATTIEIAYLFEEWSYVRRSLQTGSELRLLRAAQLDGLSGWDLVFADRTPDLRDKVQVAFGEPQGPTTPLPVGIVTNLTSIEAGIARDALGHCDGAMDLVLTVQQPPNGTVVAMYGSADRAINAPLELATDGIADIPLTPALGRSTTPGQAWMFAPVETNASEGRVYAVSDVLSGGVVATDKQIGFDSVTCPGAKGRFVWAMADVNGDGADDAIGLKASAACPLTSSGFTLIEVVPSSLVRDNQWIKMPYGVVNELAVSDFDGDGALDIAVARGDGLWVVWGQSGAWVPAPLVLDAGLQVSSVTLIDADARPGKELAFLADEAIVVVTFDERVVRELGRLDAPPEAKQLRSADVDGDGVDDLAVSDKQKIHTYLGLPHR